MRFHVKIVFVLCANTNNINVNENNSDSSNNFFKAVNELDTINSLVLQKMILILSSIEINPIQYIMILCKIFYSLSHCSHHEVLGSIPNTGKVCYWVFLSRISQKHSGV